MGGPDATPRPLSTRERAILDKLLAVDFPEADAARAQVGGEVLGRDGCSCGCGSFDLIVPGAPEGPGGFQPVAEIARYSKTEMSDDPDDPYIDVMLWMSAGRVGGVEVVYYSDERRGLPNPDELLAEEPPGWRATREAPVVKPSRKRRRWFDFLRRR